MGVERLSRRAWYRWQAITGWLVLGVAMAGLGYLAGMGELDRDAWVAWAAIALHGVRSLATAYLLPNGPNDNGADNIGG